MCVFVSFEYCFMAACVDEFVVRNGWGGIMGDV